MGDTTLASPVPAKPPTAFPSADAAAVFAAPVAACEGAFEEEGCVVTPDFFLGAIRNDGDEDDGEGGLHNLGFAQVNPPTWRAKDVGE
jgi:hypothetical protein